MKRWLLAIVVLLGGSLIWAHADYVIIRVNLAVTKEEKDDSQQGQPGRPGQPNAGGLGQGLMQQRGGIGGKQPGGGQGPALGFQGGGAGFQGAAPQLGRGGALGLQGGGAGFGGAGRQMMQQQMQGQMQRMQGNLQQPGGGNPMMQMMRGGSGMGMMGQQGAKMMSVPGEDDEEESTPLLITAIVEAKQVRHLKEGHTQIIHKWGKTDLPHQRPGVEWQILKLPTVAQRFDQKSKDIKDDSPTRANELLDLAKWALEHSLTDEVPNVMAKLGQVEANNATVALFQKVQAAVSRKNNQDDAAINWREKLGDFKAKYSDHYVLLYDVKDDQEADSRLGRLEQNFKAFYYWFALHGKELRVPDRRLVAMLVYDPEIFKQKHKDIFDETQLVTDGFYARRENLAIFSAKRFDENYVSLTSVARPIWDKFDRDQLLKGSARAPRGTTLDKVAEYQTVALLLKSLENEAELASVTYEGTRQLIAAAGLLPRNVETPRWIDFGMASFFETPETVGDYYGAFWPGVGVSLPYFWRFKVWDRTKSVNLDRDAARALKSVVSDRYFHEISDGKKKETEQARARTMAWSLIYYLAEKRLDGLLKYYEELGNLPRDLEFDDEILLTAFARAFNLVTAPNSNEIDAVRWSNFANDWYRYVRETNVEMELLAKQAIENFKKKKSETKPSPTATRAGPY
jgi:hypothetical protein